MEDWLEQVSAVAQQRAAMESPVDIRFKHRREFRRCSTMVRDALVKLSRTYWPTTPRRRLRISLIPMEPLGQSNPVAVLWNCLRNHRGWRVRNTATKESFEISLILTAKGFCFELPDEYRTTDTSKEQLQDALCKAAIRGPIGYGDRDVMDLI